MIKCLLCGEVSHQRQTFSSLFPLNQAEQAVCRTCQQGFQRIAKEHCPACYKSGEQEICSDCHYWQEKGQAVNHASLYQYTETMAAYFSVYKFQGDYLLRKVFAKDFQNFSKQWKGYTFVPVPISQQRLAERGFNQVEGLLQAAKIPYQSLLEKSETEKQSSKTRSERLQLNQPFRVKEGVSLPNRLVLVDDIYTTGTTLMRAKETLLQAGVSEVVTISLAR